MFSIRKAIRTLREHLSASPYYDGAPFTSDYPVARPGRYRGREEPSPRRL
jgi:hypothetical protein